ncbi:pilus assembly protein TadG-related protein [Streptomyces sp. NPDC047108]|uniref:pilus assembly protein TadG-related protein n=1 Tax=Streptomyces sp. NPDC047108 TaxID=3155025 RepID=UPI0033E65080
MTAVRHSGDRGQAFPIYVTVVGALLFLAFAFFAVGQASATRNGAQTAADAASLAWAQDVRDELRTGLLDAVENGEPWEDWLEGQGLLDLADCPGAHDFADRNRADVTSCGADGGLRPEFTVEVRTQYPVGRSVIPGTEGTYGTAKATAVIEPRCRLTSGDDTGDDTGDEPGGPPGDGAGGDPDGEDDDGDGGGSGGDGDGGDGGEDAPRAEFTCDGKDWTVDPGDDGGLLPSASDLFSVHLTD